MTGMALDKLSDLVEPRVERLRTQVASLESDLAAAQLENEALRRVVAAAEAMYPHARSTALNDALDALRSGKPREEAAESEPARVYPSYCRVTGYVFPCGCASCQTLSGRAGERSK
jgi:regulator of replication initiation timing